MKASSADLVRPGSASGLLAVCTFRAFFTKGVCLAAQVITPSN
jgi:hypothetical protein